jgi:hypothetical protein
MRDAIISADIVEGRMSRQISFDNDDTDEDKKSVVELMEEKFKLLEKIKNFIVPRTLEYGEYYVYIMPYSKLFGDFDKFKNQGRGGRMYRESICLNESVSISADGTIQKTKRFNKNSNQISGELKEFCESAYNDYKKEFENSGEKIDKNFPTMEEFSNDLSKILGNIEVNNDAVPLAVLEEGYESIYKYVSEADNGAPKSQEDLFTKVNTSSEGIHMDKSKKDKKSDKEFSEIRDCYIRLIDPTKVVPLKILDSTFGYYYVEEEDITPLANSVANSLYMTNYDQETRHKSIIDNIVDRIVKSFDKKFLSDNVKFKKEIANAISYYNLSKKKIKFQFIPVEYMVTFKIDEDEQGNGTSMLKKSLFYAKLYLMLLLFKIMSIILYSNDQKVNYIKMSGIDKDIMNKTQEIARMKQNRQINIMDLFSYTTLINKVGNGNELYIPTGRSGERPMETEILQGQEVQLNSDLLEMLKNAYITATGVPFELINQLNQVEFAKQIEQSNTRMNGRVVNYQLDFNPTITDMYQKIMRYSTNLDETDILGFKFVLQPPKTTAGNVKNEAIQTLSGLLDFIIGVWFDDPNASTDANIALKIREFKKLMIADQLPMLNVPHIEELVKSAALNAKEKVLEPDPVNGDEDLSDLEGDLAGAEEETP